MGEIFHDMNIHEHNWNVHELDAVRLERVQSS